MKMSNDTDVIYQLFQDIINEARILHTRTPEEQECQEWKIASTKLCSWFINGIAHVVTYPFVGHLGELLEQKVKTFAERTKKFDDHYKRACGFTLCHEIHPGQGCLCLVNRDTGGEPPNLGRPFLGLISTAKGLGIVRHNYTLVVCPLIGIHVHSLPFNCDDCMMMKKENERSV